MKKTSHSISAALVVALLHTGCQNTTTISVDPENQGTADQQVIGGIPANAKVFEAVGAIGWPYDTGSGKQAFAVGCTATLISPTTILTAKHCLRGSGLDPYSLWIDSMPFYFALGKDMSHPTHVVQIISGVLPEPILTTSFPDSEEVGLGTDMAIGVLAKPILDVSALAVAAESPTQQQVGSQWVTVGFGVQNRNGVGETRVAGAMTLRGVSGSGPSALFETEQTFLDYFNSYASFGFSAVRPELSNKYQQKMVEQYQAYVGGAPGDSDVCFGDSGGPLLRKTDSGVEVVGVTSMGLDERYLFCSMGAYYATFGPKTQTVLAQRDDPCAGIPSGGRCSGSTAIRCTGPGEGRRRPVVVDCSLVGSTCGLDASGNVSCSDEGTKQQPLPTCGGSAQPLTAVRVNIHIEDPTEAPMGGELRDGTYELVSADLYWGKEKSDVPADTLKYYVGKVAGRFTVKGNSIQSEQKVTGAAQFTPPLLPARGNTVSATITERGAAHIKYTTTCPMHGNGQQYLYYSATNDEVRVVAFRPVPDLLPTTRQSAFVSVYKRVN